MKLVVNNLDCLRGARTILSGLSFSVKDAHGLLLRGPNGSGKTTLLRTLAGFLRPGAGEIRLEGGDEDMDVGEQCHYVGHLNGVKASLTVRENLRFWQDFLGGKDIDTALETFELSTLAEIPAGLLSAGQKRRLGLARLLLVPRSLWLLDEPSVSLDVHSVEVLASVVQGHIQKGGIVVAASHVPLGLDFADTLELGGPAADDTAVERSMDAP